MRSLSITGRAAVRRLLPLSTRWALIERLGAEPRLYFPLARLMRYDRVVDDATDVVIEGYPRSANSFARWAFESAQPVTVEIAHHRHVPAQVIRGVELDKPVLVLIREPRGACVSQAIFLRDQVPMRQVVRAFCRFYQDSLAARDRERGFEVALFQQVTSDFGLVMNRLNERFGTSFTPFVHSPENVERCFALEEQHYRNRHGRLDEMGVARPSSRREEEKARHLEVFESRALGELRQSAQALYETYAEMATAT